MKDLIQPSSTDSSPKVELGRLSSFSIGITGEVHGAGSTTTANMLAQIFGFGYKDAGQTIRDLAVKQGYADNPQDDGGLINFSQQYLSKNPDIDARLDCRIITEALGGNCIFEGKAAVVLAKAHKLPRIDPTSPAGWSLTSAQDCNTFTPIFSIVLKCDEKTAARRILLRKDLYANNIDPNSSTAVEKRNNLSVQEVEEQIKISRERLNTFRQNWDRLYNLSALEKGEGQYDICVDTTDRTPEQVVGTILCRLVAKPQFFSLLSDATRAKIEDMFPGIQELYPVE